MSISIENRWVFVLNAKKCQTHWPAVGLALSLYGGWLNLWVRMLRFAAQTISVRTTRSKTEQSAKSS